MTKLHLAVQSIIIYLSSLVITGYHIYISNQVLVIPLVLVTIDPALYANDPYVATLTNYAAPIWRVIPLVAEYVPLEGLLTALFLASRGLLIFAAARLGLAFSQGSALAAVGAMAFFALWPSPFVGSGTLVTPYFEHTSLSVAFLLLAAVSFYTMRPYLWALWLAIGFNLNSMYGTYACVYFAAVFLVDKQYRTAWRNWLVPGGLFILLSAPTIVITASAFQIGAADRELWLKASYARFPYHLYPLTWAAIQYLGFFVFVLVFSLVIYRARKDMPKLFRQGLVWLAVGIFWLIFAFIAAYIAESPAMLVTHPARGTDLLFALAAVAIISILAYYIDRGDKNLKLLVLFYFASILFYSLFDNILFITVSMLAVTITILLPPLWNFLLKQGYSLRVAYVVVLITVLFAATRSASGSGLDQLRNPIGYPDQQMIEIADWAKQTTSKEDVFLVNPNWSEFRSLSQRPVFVTWKDGSAILWERSYVEQWVKRMDRLGYDFNNPREIGRGPGLEELLLNQYRRIDDSRAAVLADRYAIRYWIVSNDQSSAFREVFRTQDYKVLEIPAPDG